MEGSLLSLEDSVAMIDVWYPGWSCPETYRTRAEANRRCNELIRLGAVPGEITIKQQCDPRVDTGTQDDSQSSEFVDAICALLGGY